MVELFAYLVQFWPEEVGVAKSLKRCEVGHYKDRDAVYAPVRQGSNRGSVFRLAPGPVQQRGHRLLDTTSIYFEEEGGERNSSSCLGEGKR